MEFVSEDRKGQEAPPPSAIAKGPLEGADPTHTFLVERVKGGFFKPTIYSIRPIMNEGSHGGDADGAETGGQQRLWARMHYGQKNLYCISGDIEDLNKPRKKRSSKFVGKIQVDYPQRVYRGWTQNAHDDVRSHLVTVVYDHERMAAADFKMEVGLPLQPTANFHEDFMTVFREGTQNMAFSDRILVLFQGDDSHNMATEESLKGLQGTAAMVSTKNFNLVKGKPVRGNMYASDNVDEEEHGKKSPKAAADAVTGTEEEAFMYFGKLSSDKFSCRFRQPIDLTTAFMLILSRFDTTQKFD